METWYCLIHFPDGRTGIHLVPGPAAVQEQVVVRISDRPGQWVIEGIRSERLGYAAELWVQLF